ncbi:F0F1 ATP synthase subunit epsilon [Marininema halotolerans]|uniref:ATP synthase epsilon chain n=1 Tax=Marininema halotolerans TaxID=1155944 RepID=A0A1I6P2N2_9BACL|nr:F0F1 ATP synthase subunit epsilon [Marininema halotolerans]SFS34415.1 F-type H+-transporting ATPase subunit epsilon [Marininema halotolerans]
MSTTQLDIVTPEKKVYSDQVDMVTARAAEGDIGILANHAPFISPLQVTAVKAKKDGQDILIAITGGFMEVHDNKVTILAETAELPSEIDVDRAIAAKERAEERLAGKKQENVDFERAQLALQRAAVRINVGKSR